MSCTRIAIKKVFRETESFQYLKSNYLNNSGRLIKESKTTPTTTK